MVSQIIDTTQPVRVYLARDNSTLRFIEPERGKKYNREKIQNLIIVSHERF